MARGGLGWLRTLPLRALFCLKMREIAEKMRQKALHNPGKGV